MNKYTGPPPPIAIAVLFLSQSLVRHQSGPPNVSFAAAGADFFCPIYQKKPKPIISFEKFRLG